MNFSDHNPAVKIDVSPEDSWELSTPQAMKYYVKGGKNSNGKHGFVFSNANWDPYPLGNEIEGFAIALANMDVAVMLRIDRFNNPFFTLIKPADVVKDMEIKPGEFQPSGFAPPGNAKAAADLFQEVQTLAEPLPPSGFALIGTVEDLEGQTHIKLAHAQHAVDDTVQILAQDLLTATYWLDVRKAQDPARSFGDAPTAAWNALRKAVPWRQDGAVQPDRPAALVAYSFLKANPAGNFFSSASIMPNNTD
jgi:histidine ammonia-lyase